jgi:hypothetical protein
MESIPRDQLAAILAAGNIRVTDDAVFMLIEGITEEDANSETRQAKLARATGVNAGLAGISSMYQGLKEAERQHIEGWHHHEKLDKTAKQTRHLIQTLVDGANTKQGEDLHWRFFETGRSLEKLLIRKYRFPIQSSSAAACANAPGPSSSGSGGRSDMEQSPFQKTRYFQFSGHAISIM